MLCCHNTDNTRRHLQCSAVTIRTTQDSTYSALLSQYGQHKTALTVLCCHNTDNTRRHLQCSVVTIRTTQDGTYSALLSQYGQHKTTLTVLCCHNTDNTRRHLQCYAVTRDNTRRQVSILLSNFTKLIKNIQPTIWKLTFPVKTPKLPHIDSATVGPHNCVLQFSI